MSTRQILDRDSGTGGKAWDGAVTGNMSTRQILDRDSGTGGKEVWELSVQAWDEGGNGEGNSVPFTLTLTDINDNAPYLIQVRVH